ncbi:hypothetical protein QUB63_24405 [Microcoleus sp. ARI1-B5]|uniref:hypothetical protein n=1 Tax=unclassified Microcoleus TaxID=2642155 RepID=UPI002FD73B73
MAVFSSYSTIDLSMPQRAIDLSIPKERSTLPYQKSDRPCHTKRAIDLSIPKERSTVILSLTRLQ